MLATVQQAAVGTNRFYPVSLGAEGSCQIGGIIATNAGGTGVLRYGNTRDNVLGIEVVLPDGTVWDGLYALRKNNTGYDLKHLFIGSEGTLGIVTGAVLKLHPLPTARSIAWLGVVSPQTALDVLALFRATLDARLTAFELMDENQVAMVAKHIPSRRCPLDRCVGWHLLVELSDTSDSAALDEAMQDGVERAFESGYVGDAVRRKQRGAARRHVGVPAQRVGGEQEGRSRSDDGLRRAGVGGADVHGDGDAAGARDRAATCRWWSSRISATATHTSFRSSPSEQWECDRRQGRSC